MKEYLNHTLNLYCCASCCEQNDVTTVSGNQNDQPFEGWIQKSYQKSKFKTEIAG